MKTAQLLSLLLTACAQAFAQVPADAPAASASAPTAAASAALPAGPEAFQGLPWGAGEAQIAERFAGRLAPVSCDAAARQAAARLGEVCDVPQVPRYEVAGIPFVLRLHLDAQDRLLVRVSLTHTVEGLRGDDSRWSEQHRTLRRLLSQRYGSAETTDVNNEAGAYTAFARWRRGMTVIELHSFVSRSGGGREQVQVVYQNVLHGEAGKL